MIRWENYDQWVPLPMSSQLTEALGALGTGGYLGSTGEKKVAVIGHARRRRISQPHTAEVLIFYLYTPAHNRPPLILTF